MHFTCRGIQRKRTRQARHGTSGAWQRDESPARDEGAFALLEDLITKLPPRDREVVVRRYHQREPFADIGRSLDISAEAARKRVDRALAQCRAAMAGGSALAEPTLTPDEWK